MRDQELGVLRRNGLHEDATTNFENAIDEVLEFTGSRQGEMALEDDAVET
jgi:hypothetical protein